ncbi:MAG: malto-oligosyltrehalose trehalohydrolase, partial [Actinomycetota bacterium]
MTESVWPDRLDARVGPQLIDGGCRFRIWAPLVAEVQLHVLEPEDRLLPMKPLDHGYHEVIADGVSPGARYVFRFPGGDERADPASRFQPEGVHGQSEVIDDVFAWSDSGWAGITIEDLIIYELHVGLFTPEGTFQALIGTLD